MDGTQWNYMAASVDARARARCNVRDAPLSVPAVEVGGITLYRLTPQALAPYRELTALAMERRAELARFEALLLAAGRYLDGGGDLG